MSGDGSSSRFPLGHHRLDALRPLLVEALRVGRATPARNFALACLQEAGDHGFAAGWSADDVIAAARDYIATSAALDAQAAAELARPVIELSGGDRHLVVLAAERALAARRELFTRGGALIRVGQAQHLSLPADDDGRSYTDPARVLMAPAEPDWLTTRLTEEVEFLRPSGRAQTPKRVDAPDWLARALIAERHWPSVRALNGVTSAPIVRADGTVRTAPGYDEATGMLLVTAVEFPAIAPAPDKDAATAALAILLRPFECYQFAAEAGRSVALSLVLSRLARHLMPTTPLHLAEAPKAGTGKTMLVEAASIIVDGVRPSLRAWPESDEEMRKAITACLLSSHGMVCFDNVPNGQVMRSAVLDKLITNVIWEDRLLGGNSNVYLHNNLVIAATGNNVRPSQDTIRRVISARIATDDEEPWRRAFPFTPVEFAQRHRVALVSAACTLLAAFIGAGMPAPAGLAPLGTFEDWSRIIRNALLWLDLADPVSTQDAFALHDPAREALVDLLAALRVIFSDARFRCLDVVTLAASASMDTADSPAGSLRMALRAIFDGHLPDMRRLGRYFDTHRDEVAGGLRLLAEFDAHAKANRWRVVPAARGECGE